MRDRPAGNKTLRHSIVHMALLLAVTSVAVPSSSEGSIYFYRLGKRLFYDQTSNSQPTTPTLIDGGVDLYASDASDLSSARVFSTKPALLSPASPFVLNEYTPGGWISSQPYPTIEDVDTNIPPGDVFGFLIEGGNLGSRLALLSVPETNLFALDVPYFTGNAFSQLNGLDVSQPYTLQWNSLLPAPGITEAPIFFNLYRVSDGQSMLNAVLPDTETSIEIPADTLTPSTQYAAQVDFSSRVSSPDAGFIDADAAVLFDSVTTLYFLTTSGGGAASATIPEPSFLGTALAGLLASASFWRSKSSRWVVVMVVVIAGLTTASSSLADIHFYRVGKTIVHQQTSDAPPSSTPVSIYGGVDMFTSLPAEIGTARVFSTTTMPPSPVPEFALTQFSPGYWGSSRGYSSVAEMDTELPPGDTFGFLIEGGDLGDQLALLRLPSANLFSTTIPSFTGNAFSQLNGHDATQIMSVSWNTFVPAVSVNEAILYFNIYRVSDGQQMIGAALASSATSFVVPADTLAPNTAYTASLNFSSRKNDYDAGFGQADATALFDSVNNLQFTTGNRLPGDYNRDDHVSAADYLVWRKTFGQTGLVPYSGADGDGDGEILSADYSVWRTNFSSAVPAGAASSSIAIPETASATLSLMALAALRVVRRGRR